MAVQPEEPEAIIGGGAAVEKGSFRASRLLLGRSRGMLPRKIFEINGVQ